MPSLRWWWILQCLGHQSLKFKFTLGESTRIRCLILTVILILLFQSCLCLLFLVVIFLSLPSSLLWPFHRTTVCALSARRERGRVISREEFRQVLFVSYAPWSKYFSMTSNATEIKIQEGISYLWKIFRKFLLGRFDQTKLLLLRYSFIVLRVSFDIPFPAENAEVFLKTCWF